MSKVSPNYCYIKLNIRSRIASHLLNPIITRSHSIPKSDHPAIALSPFNLTQRRSHFFPSTSHKGDRTLSLQPHPKAIALSPFNLTQRRSHFFPSTSPKDDRTFSLQPHPKAIALPPFNLTLTRSHSLPSTQRALAEQL
ncbi:MAG: hypothetical protein RLP02_17110 [Coleofasciculus sp. C2-GNP5-27]